MDRTTLLDKGIHISDLDIFIWIQMKQNYDNHIERLKKWKNINEEEEWLIKQCLSLCFFMKWEAMILDIMLEFLNTFVINGINIYFGYQNKVYVINK
jgi:hypothetical protein